MTTICGVVETPPDFRALQANWNTLLAKAGSRSPCLTWEWMYAWWLHYGQADVCNRLAIITVSENDTLIGLLPAYVRTTSFCGSRTRTLALLGTTYESSDYLEVLCDPGRADVARAAFDFATTVLRVDRLRLGNTLATGPSLALFQDLATGAGFSHERYDLDTCPFISITGSWSDYQARLSRNFREVLHRRTRRFFEIPQARFDWVQDRGEVATALDTLFDLHRRRFARKNAVSGFVEDVRGDFHKTISHWFFDRNILRLFRLRVGAETVAVLYCFEHADALFYYQGGLDPEWENRSVGTVLMGQVIKYAFDRGLAHFDFMRGEEAYKSRWTDRRRDIVLLDVGVSRKGRSLVALARTAFAAKRSARKLIQLAL